MLRRPPRTVTAFIVLILVQLFAVQSLGLFAHVTAIDFYQYWGVAAVRRLEGTPLGTPYTDGQRYSAALKEHAARSDQPKLVEASRIWSRPDFAASPFLYVLFAALPGDYGRALVLFYALQLLLFVGALVLLGSLYRYQTLPLLCITFLLVLASGPLSSDLRVGNLGCFQLFALTVILALADRLARARSPAVLGALLLSGLTLLALAKPNVTLIAAVMAVHVLLGHGGRFFAIVAVPTVISAAAAIAIPCIYFGSWTVWREWYGFVLGSNPHMLVRPAALGNYSTPLLLSSLLHGAVWTTAALTAAVLVVSLVAVTAARRPANEHEHPAGAPAWVLARLFEDPHLAIAIGISATIALSPLFWYHYYLLALIPGLWLLNAGAEHGPLSLLGLAALVLSTGLPNVLLLPLGWTGAVAAGAASSWLPLWGGILLWLYSNHARPMTAPAPSAAEASAGSGASNLSRSRRHTKPRTRSR